MRVGVVEEQLVDGEQPVTVGVLVVCVALRERIKRHRGDVCRQGVGRPYVSGKGRTGENVGDGVCVEPRKVVAVDELPVGLELYLERDRLVGVTVEERILPCDEQGVLRGDRVPHLARSVGFVEPVPVRLRDDAERRHERSEPVVRGDNAALFEYLRHDLSERVDAQTADVVRGDLERPIRECGVNPVVRRAKRPPIRADHGIGRRGEVELLARPYAGHHKAALDVRSLNGVRRVRRGYRLEVGKAESLHAAKREVDGLKRRVELCESLHTLKPNARQRHRLEIAASRPRHHLRNIIRAAVAAATSAAIATAVAGLYAGVYPHGYEERPQQDTSHI